MDQARVQQRVADWAEMSGRFPRLLDELLGSPAYGLCPDRPDPPADQHGVYLFTDEGRDLYVGRTGLTERAQRAGSEGSSSFLTRLTGHVKRDPGSASFAWRLTMEQAETEVLAGERDALPATREARVKDQNS